MSATALSHSQITSALAVAVAEVHQATAKAQPLLGTVVTSVINDICFSLRCRRDQLPPTIINLYERAARNKQAWFRKDEVLDIFTHAVR
jgi:hypothetical protein